MTETELQQIKGELAKYVGFAPSEGTICEGQLPDFTGSMDACFRWIKPLFGYWFIEKIDTDSYEVTVGKDAYAPIDVVGSYFTVTSNTPSLAFCLAALKYFREIKKDA